MTTQTVSGGRVSAPAAMFGTLVARIAGVDPALLYPNSHITSVWHDARLAWMRPPPAGLAESVAYFALMVAGTPEPLANRLSTYWRNLP